MSYKILSTLIIASVLVLTKAEDGNTSIVDILRIKIVLNPARIPDLIVDLLTSEDYKMFTNKTIYLKDILNFVDSSSENSSAFDSTFAMLNKNFSTEYTNVKIESAFKILNVSITDVYKEFIKNFVDENESNRIAFEKIGLSIGQLSYTSQSSNDAGFYKELNKANYSGSNFENFLNSLNLTQNEFEDIIIDIIGKRDMAEVLKWGPDTSDILKLVLTNLSIPLESYTESTLFKEMLVNYNKEINETEILATAYNQSSFITFNGPVFKDGDFIIGKIYKNNSTIYINNLTSTVVDDNFISLSTSTLNNSYVNITGKSNLPLPSNCSIIIYANNQTVVIKAVNITMDGKYVLANLENEISPNFSSPLICNNTLYGLATSNNINGSWQFITFNNSTLQPIEPTLNKTTESTTVQTSDSTPSGQTSGSTTPAPAPAVNTTNVLHNVTSTPAPTTSSEKIVINSMFNMAILCLIAFLM